MKRVNLALWISGVVLFICCVPPIFSQVTNKTLVRTIMAEACYVRETTDQEWHIRIVGTLPLGPGFYAVIWNAAGKIILQGEIPSGTYAVDKPFVLTVPADGVAGEYVIKLIGPQDNFLANRMPMTDLPFEVYGGCGFALGYGRQGEVRKVLFRVPEGTTNIVFGGWGEGYRILKADGGVLVDSEKDAVLDPNDRRKKTFEVHPNVTADETYWIDPYGIFYFGFKEPAYLAFDPARWFAPAIKMDFNKIKWWKGLAQ